MRRWLMLALLALLALLVGAPRLVPAQDADTRLDRLDPGTRAAVAAVIDSARASALPTEPLLQKALEGVSRQAEPARIIRAVRSLADRLRQARSALGASSSETELVAGAGALLVGVDTATLRRLREDQRGEIVALPLIVLADIIERGVPRDTASSVILALAGAGVPERAYTSLRESVAQDIRAGAPPAAAASTRAQGLIVLTTPERGRRPRRRP